MSLNLVDHVGGILGLDDDVEIAILEGDGERFWYVCCSSFVPSADPPEMIFRERSVPRVVRQMYAVLKWRGSVMLRDADSADVYELIGPHLSRPGADLYQVSYNLSELAFLAAFEPVPRPTDPATLSGLLSGPEFSYVFEKFENGINRPITRGNPREKVLRWRRLAAAAPRRRTLARTEILKAELIATAWHPRRMARWCLDEDERRELAEIGL